jgi:jumonji domain-containing protein 2
MIIKSPITQHCSGKGGVFEFDMVEKQCISVSDFRDKADAYKAKMEKRGKSRGRGGGDGTDNNSESNSNKNNNEDGNKSSEEDEGELDNLRLDALAKKFWKSLGPTMDAPTYGADMEATLYEGEEASGWNVDKLDSCLQLLMSDRDDDVAVPGVTSAYLYFGMWAATFAAHTEDMNLLSINILHAGEPKYWYSISEKDGPR